MNEKILLAGAVGLGLLLANGASAAKNEFVDNIHLKVSTPSNIDYSQVQNGTVKLDLGLRITNNNPVIVPLDGFSGVLKYGQYELARINLSPFTLQPNSTADFTAKLRFNLATLGGSLTALITNKDWLNAIYIVGTLGVSGVSIGINEKVHLI